MEKTTLGNFRVRVGFNPSEKTEVAKFKHLAAKFIDEVSSIEDGESVNNSGEVKRLKALAQTAAEEAAMWAVKAATAS